MTMIHRRGPVLVAALVCGDAEPEAPEVPAAAGGDATPPPEMVPGDKDVATRGGDEHA